MESCLGCASEVVVRLFPAALDRGPARDREAAIAPGEGGRCFAHPEKAALLVCEGCGRFLCRDCDTLWGSEHLCLTCIYERREVKQTEGFTDRRFLYDNAALSLAAVPFVAAYPFFWVGFLTGPMAMYYLIRHRGDSRGFVPRGRGRLVLAWVLSVTSLLGSLALLGLLLWAVFQAAARGGNL
ncbi:MAG: hypothetical protein ACC661_01640 [Verrucomicrobiales bacterium]